MPTNKLIHFYNLNLLKIKILFKSKLKQIIIDKR